MESVELGGHVAEGGMRAGNVTLHAEVHHSTFGAAWPGQITSRHVVRHLTASEMALKEISFRNRSFQNLLAARMATT